MNKKLIETLLESHPTPFYVFDTGVLKGRIAYLRSVLPENTALCYAVKANTFIPGVLKDIIDRFEVCSPGELKICRTQNLMSEKLVISGVYKDPELMEELVKGEFLPGAYTVESVGQFKLLHGLASRYKKKIPMLLRLTSGGQFGMDAEDICNIIKNSRNDPCLNILGIQYFSGTQKKSLRRLERELNEVDRLLEKLDKEYGCRLPELEFGPGLPVDYFAGENFNEEEFLQGFAQLLKGLSHKGKITLELGRSIAASCGTYLTRIVDTKRNKGQNYAIVDGGIHQMVYYGQSMAMKQPLCELFPRRPVENEQNWNICGSLCTINDILVKQMPLSDVKTGDVLIFKNTGAYAMTEGIALFLSRNLPAIVILDEKGESHLARGPLETYPLNM